MASEEAKNKKLIAGILGILLGGLGIHKFYLGRAGVGVAHILLSFLFGIGGLIGFIEGIMYLVKSDDDFERDYINGDKKWF